MRTIFLVELYKSESRQREGWNKGVTYLVGGNMALRMILSESSEMKSTRITLLAVEIKIYGSERFAVEMSLD